ncbi:MULTISPECIES: CRISPR-associated endonuclease Cas2 [unclassified Archaeoglobus]|jgi:CRISPR-associated protein Cas2|uniref:CRISPR-associated endonuclease Cas2 n=1 Tax=unclassified Archaeoglobus TaxID=2643606 RepID=UPI0025BA2CB2|nr:MULTISPECIES: CRISPR-associated endonuclease Cas2 [unclassified Archaeoglobus]
MYVIIAYDVNVERVNKVKKFLRKHLNWIQNSLFEGELTQADLEEVKMGLREIINEDEDMIVIYRLRSRDAAKREVLGIEKSSVDEII